MIKLNIYFNAIIIADGHETNAKKEKHKRELKISVELLNSVQCAVCINSINEK